MKNQYYKRGWIPCLVMSFTVFMCLALIMLLTSSILIKRGILSEQKLPTTVVIIQMVSIFFSGLVSRIKRESNNISMEILIPVCIIAHIVIVNLMLFDGSFWKQRYRIIVMVVSFAAGNILKKISDSSKQRSKYRIRV